MVVEAEKSYMLPSASWRPRKAGGVIKCESEGSRTRGPKCVNATLRVGDVMGYPSSNRKAEIKGTIPPTSAFCSIQVRVGRAIRFT